MTILRNSDGIQPLESRQKFSDMTEQDKGNHAVCLLVKSDDSLRRGRPSAVTLWSDDVERRARWLEAGYRVAEDPYKEPEKVRPLVIFKPMEAMTDGLDS